MSSRLTAVLGLVAAVIAARPGTALPFEERPVRSILEARHQNVVLQEWDSSCGAAALATLLRFQLGDPVTERSVALGMLRRTDPDRVRGRGGFSLLDMKRYAETRGFSSDGYAGLTAGQLLRLAPAIVPIRSYGGDHFVVFRGIVRGQAVLADPAFGNRSLPFTQFESQWKGGVGFVVRKPAKAHANRLFPTRRDLLRVEDDAARLSTDDALPKPLADWQLAQTFAVQRGIPVGAERSVEATGGNARANVPEAVGFASSSGGATLSTAATSATASGGPPATSSLSTTTSSLGTTTTTAVSPITTTLSGASSTLAPSLSISFPPAPSLPTGPTLGSTVTTVTSVLSPPGH